MGKFTQLFALMLAAFIAFGANAAKAQSEYFGKWPAGTSPVNVGKRLAENWEKRDFEFQSGKRQFLIYPEICTWYGALNVAKSTKGSDLRLKLRSKFDRFLTQEGSKNISTATHVDYRVIGVVPLEIYLQTKQSRYLDFGRALADKQWDKTTPDGITAGHVIGSTTCI